MPKAICQFMSVAQIKEAVRVRDGLRCTECGMTVEEHYREFRRNIEVHRLVPGSAYTMLGCVTLCKICHGSKPKTPRRKPDPSEPRTCTRERMIIDTTDRIKSALKLRFHATGLSMSDVVNQILEEALQDELEAIDARDKPKRR